MNKQGLELGIFLEFERMIKKNRLRSNGKTFKYAERKRVSLTFAYNGIWQRPDKKKISLIQKKKTFMFC